MNVKCFAGRQHRKKWGKGIICQTDPNYPESSSFNIEENISLLPRGYVNSGNSCSFFQLFKDKLI